MKKICEIFSASLIFFAQNFFLDGVFFLHKFDIYERVTVMYTLRRQRQRGRKFGDLHNKVACILYIKFYLENNLFFIPHPVYVFRRRRTTQEYLIDHNTA